MPADTPVTIPAVLTVATDEVTLVQAPPEVASLSDVVALTQTVRVPEIVVGAAGTLFTVTTLVTATLPHPFEAV